MSENLLSQIQDAISGSEITLSNDKSLRHLVRSIREMADRVADPLPAAGILLEGTVHLLRNIAADKRKEAETAVMQLLANRLATLDMN